MLVLRMATLALFKILFHCLSIKQVKNQGFYIPSSSNLIFKQDKLNKLKQFSEANF